MTPLGQDPVTNEIVNTFADPTVMIDGISGFLTTVADVFEGIERMTNAAVNMGVSTLVSIQELTENAEVQAGSIKQTYSVPQLATLQALYFKFNSHPHITGHC